MDGKMTYDLFTALDMFFFMVLNTIFDFNRFATKVPRIYSF